MTIQEHIDINDTELTPIANTVATTNKEKSFVFAKRFHVHPVNSDISVQEHVSTAVFHLSASKPNAFTPVVGESAEEKEARKQQMRKIYAIRRKIQRKRAA